MSSGSEEIENDDDQEFGMDIVISFKKLKMMISLLYCILRY